MNHLVTEKAREILNARKDRSAWNKAVTSDALEMIDNLEDSFDYVLEKYRKTEEGGAVHVDAILKDRHEINAVLLNGANDWTHYSWSGCGLVYDSDIAKHYCTPSELKRTRNGARRPNSREEWLDVQARALSQASRRVQAAIKSAMLRTYTINQ